MVYGLWFSSPMEHMIRLKALQAHFSTERVSLRLGHVFEKFQPPRELHDVCVCVVYVDMCVCVCRKFPAAA
jgi:hypothetical protein